jgi:hypothetical protein
VLAIAGAVNLACAVHDVRLPGRHVRRLTRCGRAVDATNTQNGIIGTATSYTNNFSFTTAGSDNALLVFLVFEANPGTVTAPTWNSVSLTAINACINNGTVFVCPFGMVNPAIGVHLTLAASWTNSVYASFLFLPASGADTSSIANAFKNFNSANGANATSGQGVTITDGSATPANNADVAITYQNGGATGSVTTGQTDIGFQIGASWNFDAAYGPSAASDHFGWTGNSAVAWFTTGLTINAAGGGGAAIIPIPVITSQPFTHP